MSLAEDAGLENAAVFVIDFEPDGTTWIAASDGLYRYDGYDWRRFGTAEGLPSDYVRCVTVTRGGRLWVGTDLGAGTFDEERFAVPRGGERLREASVRRIAEESDGALWFCCDSWPDPLREGGLVRLEEGEWSSFGVAEGLPTDYVTDFLQDRRGRRFALTNSGLGELRNGRFVEPWREAGLPFAGQWVWDLVDSPELGLVAATGDGLVVESDGGWRALVETPYVNARLGLTRDGSLLTCVPGRKAFFAELVDGNIRTTTPSVDHYGGAVEIVREAPDGSVWAGGLGLLLRWERAGGEWTRWTDVPDLVLTDAHSGVWFAGTERILCRSAGAWQEIPGGSTPLSQDADGGIWMRHGDGVALWDGIGLDIHEAHETGLDWPREIHPSSAGGVWVLGPVDGAYEGASFYDGEWSPRRLWPQGTRSMRATAGGPDNELWLLARDQSRNRLHRLDPTVESEVVLPRWGERDRGAGIAVGRGGALRLFGFYGLAELASEGGAVWRPIEGFEGGHVFSVVDRGDELWVGTTSATRGENAISNRRDGVWSARPANAWWLAGVGTRSELLFATPEGLLRVLSGSWNPSLLPLPTRERVVRAVSLESGEVWLQAGTDAYHFRPDGVPPETRVEHAPTALSTGEDLVLSVAAVERFRPRSPVSMGRVETRLDGGEWREHGKLEGGRLRVERPVLGAHVLEIRVTDPGLDVDPTPAVVRFDVRALPLQDRQWFLPLLVVVVLAIAALAALSLIAWRRVGSQARGLETMVETRTFDLHLSERRYRGLFEQSHDAILLVDEGQLVIEANNAAAALIGTPTGELRGRAFGELFQPSEGSAACSFLADSSIGGHLETDVRTQDGRTLSLDVRVQRLLDGAHARGRQVILHDVTERRRIEGKLRESQKLEAVGRLAAGVAHEFNNILTVLVGHCELLEQIVRDDASVLGSVRLMHEQVRRAQAITSQIRSFSRAAHGPKVVRVDAVVERMTHLLEATIGPTVELELHLRAGGACVVADPIQLEQILTNLVLNARDAIGRGGRIVVETACDAEEGTALVRVHDDGEGMDEATRSRAFEPFFTTKPPGKGTGLGLAIVHDLVEQCGGRIELETAPDRGATFSIVLPVTSASPAPEPLLSGSSPEPALGRGTVLLVEDDPGIRSLLAFALVEAGYEVESAGDAEQALDHLSRCACDLVISDIVLPGSSGTELADRLRDSHPDLRVLLMSGHSDLEAVAGAPERPCITKPFLPSELLRVVGGLLEGSAVEGLGSGTGDV